MANNNVHILATLSALLDRIVSETECLKRLNKLL